MFLIAAVLAVLYISFIKPAMLERKLINDFEHTFFRADPASIKLVRVDSGQGPIDVVRTSSGWLVAGKYKGDEGAMERLLEVMSQGRLIRIVADGAERGRFGFDDPDIVVSIGFDDSRIDAIEIAGKNPAGTGYYAYARGLGKVFLVNDEFASEMKLNLYELRDKRVFPFDPDDAYSLSITGSSIDLKLVKDSRGWSMKVPFKARCDDKSVDGFLNTLSIHRAKGFVLWNDGYTDLRKIALKIEDDKGSALIEADVRFWGSQSGKGVLVRDSGSDEAGRTGRDLWTMLKTDPSVFLKRELFDIDRSAITKIQVLWKGIAHTFIKRGDTWTENGIEMQTDGIDQLIDMLLSWKARKLVRRREMSDKVQMPLELTGKGMINKVIISNMNMDREISPTGLVLPGGEDMGNYKKVDFFLASSTALELSPIVSSLEIEKIMSIIEEIERK